MDGIASFGYWVRRRRKALDLTQDELARRVGCAATTIRKIEADVRRPSRQIAERLAECLAIPAVERAAFLQAARAALVVDELPESIQFVDNLLHKDRVTPLPAALAGTAEPSSLHQTASLLPTGTVTFLFTNIAGNTALWEQHQTAMPAALARHDAILRHAIEAHAGVIFRTVEDAVCAAFASTPNAAAAALAAQRALYAEPWGETGPLRVRMALHTGSVEAHAGDYHGLPLNRITQLLATGYGGQTLLSLAAQELVCDHLPPGVELRDLGQHRLRDLTRPEHIFQLVAPDLPAGFPPLKTLDVHPHNLPAQPTTLIGRGREIASVCVLLCRADVRLVTLTGPGGIGKTRLGLQVAVELLDEFMDGVWFVSLASIRDSILVASAIAQTLGVTETGDQPLAARLQSYLRDKRLLLLLDNFEQIVEAAPLIAELLAGCPQLKILVTSRVVLHLRGEKEIPVSSLALPDLQRLPPRDQLTQYAAVELFIQRALDAQPNFVVTNENAPAVAEICARLDGLPLAIELAAARIKLFAPEALLGRLSNRLALLTGGARDLPQRQRTIRNAIAWSYDLLDEGAQTLFRRLGVFVGGCTVGAAEAVGNADGNLPIEVLDGLASLLDQNLLQQTVGPDGEPRFVMLETIREYAVERLHTSGEVEVLRRHTHYYLALAEAAEPQLQGAEQGLWLQRLEDDHDNLRAALVWALEQSLAETAVRLNAALWRFWYVRGHLNEGRRWLETAVIQSTMLPMPIRAKVLNAAGNLALVQGDHARAQMLYEESLALRRELGDTQSIAISLNNLGGAVLDQGDYARAQMLYEESLALRRELGDTRSIADSLINLGDLALHQGDAMRAMTLNEECLALRRELGDRHGIALSLINLGNVALFQGDYAQAVALFGESLALTRELGNKEGMAYCFAGLAGVVSAAGQPARAARLFGAAEALLEAIGARMDSADRTIYDRNVVAARAQLDEAMFAAVWAEGRAMTLDQAMTCALGDSD